MEAEIFCVFHQQQNIPRFPVSIARSTTTRKGGNVLFWHPEYDCSSLLSYVPHKVLDYHWLTDNNIVAKECAKKTITTASKHSTEFVAKLGRHKNHRQFLKYIYGHPK